MDTLTNMLCFACGVLTGCCATKLFSAPRAKEAVSAAFRWLVPRRETRPRRKRVRKAELNEAGLKVVRGFGEQRRAKSGKREGKVAKPKRKDTRNDRA